MNESKIITALEVGNSKVQVFVGEIVDRAALRIISAGNSLSYGIKKSKIIDSFKASKSIEEAIVKAEKHAKISGSTVYLSLSGANLEAMRSVGSANIRSADNIVSQADIDRANEDAMSKTLPESRSFINMINCAYYLDGVYTDEALGKFATRIDSEYWLIHAESEEIANIISILKNLDIEVDEILVSSIASALAVSTKNDRKEGVLVIDMGAGSTDYALYKNSKILMTGSVPVGGEHITNDLAHGLRLYHINAEKVKKASKAIITEDEKSLSVWTRGDKQIGDKRIPLKSLNTIIRVRLEELFLIIRNEVDEFLDSSVQSVILTGGASNMQGLTELAEGVFGKKCLSDKFNSNVLKSFRRAEHATCVGILNYALEQEMSKAKQVEDKGIFSKIFKAFK